MRSELNFNGTITSWLNNNLPYPMPDIYGKCNFNTGVGFMEEGITKCNHIVTNLANKCSTLLNPKYLTSYLQVFAGSASNSGRITV